VHNSVTIQCPLEQIIGSFMFKIFVACVFEKKEGNLCGLMLIFLFKDTV